jgi:hypothetical protein
MRQDMNRARSLGLFIGMAALGWVVACVLAVFSLLLMMEGRHHDLPWQFLASLVAGMILASLPLSLTLLAAHWAFRQQSASGPSIPPKPRSEKPTEETIHWRWVILAILAGVEFFALPLSFLAAAADDDSLALSIPLNVIVIGAAVLVALAPSIRHASIVLLVLHLLGIVATTICTAFEVESVALAAPLLLVSGVSVAAIGRRPAASRIGFGLSTIALVVGATLWIVLGGISKRQAEGPLFATLVIYQILFVPLGLWSLYRTLDVSSAVGRVQFGLKHLLVMMLIVCAAAAVAGMPWSRDNDVRVLVASGLGVMVVGAILAIMVSRALAALRHVSGKDLSAHPNAGPPKPNAAW